MIDARAQRGGGGLGGLPPQEKFLILNAEGVILMHSVTSNILTGITWMA